MNLIKNLGLNIKIENLEDENSINIKSFIFKDNQDYEEKLFYIDARKEIFYLLDEGKNLLIQGENGKYFENDSFILHLNYKNLNPEKLVEIRYQNPSNLYKTYKNEIDVRASESRRSVFVQEGLIHVDLLTEDIKQGKNIVNEANQIFISDNINVETEKAKKSILFIDNQLNSLEGVLDSRKSELNSFKQENKSLNVNLEVQSIIELISDVEQKINKVNLELSQAEVNFTKSNPLYIDLIIQKEALEFQKKSIEEKIENLPLAQQEYIDLFRELEISEALYSELANRKLNFSLMEASTIGNIRVVDEAFVENLVSPKLSLIFLITFFSFLVGLGTAIFRGIFFISISNPAELKDAKFEENIIGVIPKLEDMKDYLQDKRFVQSLETLILNIETVIGKDSKDENSSVCKKILFTSPTPSNGKSFISKVISEGLARVGNKVLLIDADLKRGDQHKLFNKDLIDIESFKKINNENIEDLKITDNLYLMPRLKRLKNTFEHLYGNMFVNKLNELSLIFDYIIIDTAPALSVSDTGLLMSSSDNNFLIARHEVNRINEIKQTMQIVNQIGKNFDGIIYNDYQKPSGYYGYYDLYGDYSYRYYAERYLYEDYDNEVID